MKQEEVLMKVQNIEQLSDALKDFSITEEQKSELKSQILSLCHYISDVNEKVDYNFIIEVLDLVRMFDTKYGFDSLFKWKHDLTLILLFIRAYYQQSFWKLQDLISDLSSLEELFVKQIFQSTGKELFERRDPLIPSVKRHFGQDLTHYLNYALLCGENYMQHTAVLSQLKKNVLSLNKGNQCFFHFKKVFFTLKKTMTRMLEIGLENLNSFQFSSEESFKSCFFYV